MEIFINSWAVLTRRNEEQVFYQITFYGRSRKGLLGVPEWKVLRVMFLFIGREEDGIRLMAYGPRKVIQTTGLEHLSLDWVYSELGKSRPSLAAPARQGGIQTPRHLAGKVILNHRARTPPYRYGTYIELEFLSQASSPCTAHWPKVRGVACRAAGPPTPRTIRWGMGRNAPAPSSTGDMKASRPASGSNKAEPKTS